MINPEQIISGERIQQRCQVQIGYRKDFQFNRNIKKILTTPIYLDDLKNETVIENKTVFIYSFLAYKLPELLTFNNCNIYFHNSDQNFTEPINLKGSNIQIYCQNNGLDQARILPIGLANSMWQHGNLALFYNVIKTQPAKNKDIFFNFSVKTNPVKRNLCHRVCLSKDLTWLPKFNDQATYLMSLAQHKFAICPEGNGFDCHRIWECLYLGVIPIMIKNPFTIQLAKFLDNKNPIVIIDDWNSLDPPKLLDNYQSFKTNFEKLSLDYFF